MNLINQSIEFVHLDYRTLKNFQGDLKKVSKEEYKKLENSLKTKGNFDIIRVWKSGNDFFILDGHTRIQFFKEKKVKFNGGYEVPAVVIHAESEQDAKEKLLLLNSQYGELTKEGLASFVGNQIPAEWFESFIKFTHIDNFEWLKQVQSQQAMLSADLLPNPVIIPTNQLLTGADIITPISLEDLAEPEPAAKAPTAMDDEYSNFSLIMLHENKVRLELTLDAIRNDKGFEKREEALMHLVSLYN